MARQTGFSLSVAIALGLSVVGFSQPVKGQGIGGTLEPRARLFPSVGPGVTALKRDSAGRYYILAAPASVVSIYESAACDRPRRDYAPQLSVKPQVISSKQ